MLEQLRNYLLQLGQPQLLAGVEQLSLRDQERFLTQLKNYPSTLLKKQRELVLHLMRGQEEEVIPYPHFEWSGNTEDRICGEALVREGKVGCVILAGGLGTRLKVSGPKGTVPVTPITGKSLFQLFCETVKGASQWAGEKLPLCFMTSRANHDATLSFFKEHNLFGLYPSQLSFFEQGMLPFVDDEGNWMLEKPGVLAEGPDGNGHALHNFLKSGLFQTWKDAGVEYVNIIFIDNPLADPFDPELVGFTQRKKVDAALKAIERNGPDEKMGVLAESDGKLKVIEYSELPEDSSTFRLSSTGMFCLKMSFIQSLKEEFPLHLARKPAEVFVENQQKTVDVWKCERFLFDLLDKTLSSSALLCAREKVFAPLKNATGPDSIDTVKRALFARDREIYQSLTGLIAGSTLFELDPAFYYPTEALKQKLKRCSLQGYIDSGL